jgi:hypothetical protein
MASVSDKLWPSIPVHWRHLKAFRERLSEALAERQHYRRQRERLGAAYASQQREASAEGLAPAFVLSSGTEVEQLQRLVQEVFNVLSERPRDARTDAGRLSRDQLRGARYYLPYYAVVRLRTAIDMLLWLHGKYSAEVSEGILAPSQDTIATGTGSKLPVTWSMDERPDIADSRSERARVSLRGAPVRYPQTHREPFPIPTEDMSSRFVLNSLLREAIQLSDAAFFVERFRNLQIEPGLVEIWHVLVSSLCLLTDAERSGSMDRTARPSVPCRRHEHVLHSMIAIQRWRAAVRLREPASPWFASATCVAFMLFEGFRRASAAFDDQTRALAYFGDLLNIIELMTELPALGLLQRLSTLRAWELMFLMCCSESKLWNVRIPPRQAETNASAVFHAGASFAAGFYERLVRPLHEFRLSEGLDARHTSYAADDALLLAEHCGELAMQTLRAVIFDNAHGAAYKRAVVSLLTQLMFELGQASRTSRTRLTRATLCKQILDASGDDYGVLDGALLCLPLQRGIDAGGVGVHTPSGGILRWHLLLEPVDDSVTAQHTYIDLLMQRAMVWRSLPRFPWLVLFLVHQVALSSFEQVGYLDRLDQPTRQLVALYRQRMRSSSQLSKDAVSTRAPLVCVSGPGVEEGCGNAHDPETHTTFVQVRAGDVAHAVLSAIHSDTVSAVVQPAQQFLWDVFESASLDNAEACLSV